MKKTLHEEQFRALYSAASYHMGDRIEHRERATWSTRKCCFRGGVEGAFLYRGADKSLARPTSRCILFDDENISFDASLVFIYK